MADTDKIALLYLEEGRRKLHELGAHLEASNLAWAEGYFMELTRNKAKVTS